MDGSFGIRSGKYSCKIIELFSKVNLILICLTKKIIANIKFKRVNAHTGKEVAWENIIRGYKMNDKYVILTPEDFEKASPEKTKMIGIDSFVEEAEIDGMYFEAPYYLQPEKAGVRSLRPAQEMRCKKRARPGWAPMCCVTGRAS